MNRYETPSSNIFSSSTSISLNTSKSIQNSSTISRNDSSEKIGKTNPFSKMKDWADKKKLDNSFEKTIKWSANVNDKPINIKISDLAIRLGISKTIVLKYINKGEAGIEFLRSKVEQKKLLEIERLSNTLNLPSLELLNQEQDGKLEEYLLNKNMEWVDGKGNSISVSIKGLADFLEIDSKQIIDFIKKGELDKFKAIVNISNELNLPLKDLIKPSGNFEAQIHKFAQQKYAEDRSKGVETNHTIVNIAKMEINSFNVLGRLAKNFKLPLLELVNKNSSGELSDYLTKNIKFKWMDKETTIPILAKELNIKEQDLLKIVRQDTFAELKDFILYSKNLNIPLAEILEINNKNNNSSIKNLDVFLLNTFIEKSKVDNKWCDKVDAKINILEKLAEKLMIPKSLLLAGLKHGQFSQLINKNDMVINPSAMEQLKDVTLLSKTLKIDSNILISHFDELDEFLMKTLGKVDWFNDDGSSSKKTIGEIALMLNVSPKLILENVKSNNLKKFNDYARLATSLDLPIEKIIKHKEDGTFDYFLFNKTAEKLAIASKLNVDKAAKLEIIEAKYNMISMQLDALYKAHEGKLVTQNLATGKFESINEKELKAIKKTIRSSLIVFGESPPKTDQIISNRILIKPTGDSFQITGLFGKKLGEGAAGYAIHSVDITNNVTLASGEEAVLKKPKFGSNPILEQDEMMRESSSIAKIHGDGKILGIQKKVRVVKDIIRGKASYSHFGSLYQSDLQSVIEPKEIEGSKELGKTILSPQDSLSFSYQLMHGVYHMHKADITHGDIKPGNIFCDPKSSGGGSTEGGPLLYLADFGASVDHSRTDSLEFATSGTPEYRLLEDMTELDKAKADYESKKETDLNAEATYKNIRSEIEKKADIFATCSVLCSFFTNELPYNRGLIEAPLNGVFILNANLDEQLSGAGLGPETIALLKKGLSADYKERPNPEKILNAFQNEMENSPNVSPERKKFLVAQSTI